MRIDKPLCLMSCIDTNESGIDKPVCLMSCECSIDKPVCLMSCIDANECRSSGVLFLVKHKRTET